MSDGCADLVDVTGDDVNSDEANDFLAEILKEEQENARKLKEAVEEERKKLAEDKKKGDKKKDKKDKNKGNKNKGNKNKGNKDKSKSE